MPPTFKYKSANNHIFSDQTDLNRNLGLTETFAIVIGRILGSGIFRTPAPIMILVSSVSLFGGIWIIGGLATLLGAICYAELVAMIPRSGGPYAYLKASYPPVWTFLRGWAMFFVSETGAIAAVALVFAGYANALWEIATGEPYSLTVQILIALATIWILTIINCLGVKFGGLIQDFFSSLKILALGAVIAVGFSFGGNLTHFSTDFFPSHFNLGTFLGFSAAMRYAFFAYSGWEGPTYIAEEVKNPRRNLPLAMILGIVGIMILYLAANGAYLYQLGVTEIKAHKWVATAAMRMAIGTAGGVLISLAVMLNTFGNISAQVLCKARTWYAMARDGLFFSRIGTINHKTKTPNTALIAQAFWASVLLLGAAFAENAYETIIDYFTFTSRAFDVMTFTAVFVLRRKYPNQHRPYRAWGYPFTLIIVVLIQFWIMSTTLITALVPSLFGILLTSTGLLYFYRKAIIRFIQKLR